MFFLLLLSGAVANDNSIERVELGDGKFGYKGTLYVGETLTETPVYYTGDSYTRASIPGVTTPSTLVYVYRMTEVLNVSVDATETGYAVVPLAALPTFTIIFALYGMDFFLLGPVAPELELHLFELGCNTKLEYESYAVDLTSPEHVISNDTLCGTTIGKFTLDCANSTRGATTVLSAASLELGVHKSRSGEYCFYTPNHFEVSVSMAWISVWSMIFIMLTVVDLTEGLVADPDGTLYRLSVTYATGINDVLLFSLMFNLYVAARHNHTIYGFAVMRAVSKEVIDVTIMGFAYGICPLITGGALWAMVAGAMLVEPTPPTTSMVGTWGLSRDPGLAVRVAEVVGAAALGGASAWFTVETLGGDLASKIITVCSSVLFILHYSTPTLISSWVGTQFGGRKTELAIYIRWCAEFLPVSSLIVAIPHDIVGILTTPFNVMILAGLGVAMIVVTARDAAFLDVLLYDCPCRHLIHPVVLVVLWYLTVFTITPVFANTDALGNSGRLALLSASASTMALFSSSYMVYHGRAPALLYNRTVKKRV